MCNSRQVFPRRYRISRREGYADLLRSRPEVSRWFAVHWRANARTYARLGVAISKKLVPLVVQRNRIKRQIRECFRRLPCGVIGLDVVVRLLRVPTQAEQAEAFQSLYQVLSRILVDKCDS